MFLERMAALKTVCLRRLGRDRDGEHGCDPGLAKTVKPRLIEVREIDQPDTVEPLLWRLLTTHQIDTPADAWRIVGWCKARWIIEQRYEMCECHSRMRERLR